MVNLGVSNIAYRIIFILHAKIGRVRGFPFDERVRAFLDEHELLFVIEQNRDAQLRTMLVTEQEIDPARLVPVLHYDGTPITARFITEAIAKAMAPAKVEPIKKGLVA